VIQAKRLELRELALEETALRATFHHADLHRARKVALTAAERELAELKSRQAALTEVRGAVKAYGDRIESGDWGPPAAHLVHVHRPEPELPPQPRAIELWAALSGGLAIGALALLLVFRPAHWIWIALVVVTAFGAMEAVVSRRLTNYLLNIALVLAGITSLILLFEFWEIALLVVMAIVVAFVVRDNLRELGRA
jgi:hypothetical protein